MYIHILFFSDITSSHNTHKQITDHHTQAVRNGSGGGGPNMISNMFGDEGMFVFQTQSASTISRTIDYRARELARTTGQRKITRECWWRKCTCIDYREYFVYRDNHGLSIITFQIFHLLL